MIQIAADGHALQNPSYFSKSRAHSLVRGDPTGRGYRVCARTAAVRVTYPTATEHGTRIIRAGRGGHGSRWLAPLAFTRLGQKATRGSRSTRRMRRSPNGFLRGPAPTRGWNSGDTRARRAVDEGPWRRGARRTVSRVRERGGHAGSSQVRLAPAIDTLYT